MSNCPFCNEQLSAESVSLAKCQVCGSLLPDTEAAADSSPPVLSPRDDSPVGMESGNAATLDSWDNAWDSISRESDSSQTIDVPSDSHSWEATNGDVSEPAEPSVPANLTDTSQTIDLPPQSGNHEPIEENSHNIEIPLSSAEFDRIGDSSQTIDLPSTSGEYDRIGDSSQTIDLPAGGSGSWEDPRIGDTSRTIDLTSASAEDARIGDSSRTIDLSSVEADSRIGDSSQTIDLTTDSALIQKQNRTKRVRPSEKTLLGASSSDGPEMPEEGLASAWEGTLVGHQPQQTLRVDSTIATSGRSSIVVKPRNLVKADASMAPNPGADYELLSVIGEGGMGVVYSARQASVDRLVALKMLKGERKLSDDQRDKFISEAVVTGDLDHPNIVPIYDLGANEEGALFYSMKQVHGTPWMKVIRNNSLEENLEILMKVADAVGFAHEAGVIHRDLKPENVMLGKHGEVLVMDWGLALATESFRAIGSITQTGSMGGTPAYMSPEMATGPVDRVTFLSDIYLLGGILYEVVTGQLPHTGTTVLECLKNAAKNRIQPTSKSGELLEIANKAMATDPAERYPSVEAFQKAIREYRSHSESIRLSEEAETQLAKATQSDDYRDYADSMYGFENAVKLWSGNTKARKMLSESKLAYAETAARREDFDLGLSILDPTDENHTDLIAKIDKDRRERNARQNRIRTLRYLSAALVGVLLLVISAAFFLVMGQRNLAQKERDRAVEAESQAKLERDKAEEARKAAVVAKEQTTKEWNRAEEEKTRAEEQTKVAEAQTEVAKAEKIRADEARDEAIEANMAERYAAYVAQIGLASARIKENSFDSAVAILNGSDERFRNWEWGRLAYLCQQSVEDFQADGPMDSVAFDRAGERLATGSWDGKARVWDARSGELRATIPHGRYVHAVAFSPNGSALAIGSSDPVVKLVNSADGTLIREFPGHEASVLSVTFSRDGRHLLTTSYDKTARLWDVATGRMLQQLQGHNWWVWSAAFSPDGNRIVTASQDGKAIVWQKPSTPANAPYKRVTEFTSHGGPVYSAVFSPDGQTIASGGFGKRVLIWNPDEIAPPDLKKRVDRIAEAPQKYRALEGHSGAVRSVDFSANGKLLVSGAQDNTVRVWDVATGTLIKALRGHGGQVRSCVFSHDGKTVASASHDKRVKLWNLDGYEEVRVLRGRVLAGHVDAVLDAAFSPDGNQIVTASRDRTARTWDVKTGKAEQTLAEGHEFLATAARFTQNGQSLITSGGDNTVRVWDVASGTQHSRLDRTGRSSAVAVSHDGSLVLTGGDDRTAKLWHLTSGKMVQQLIPGTAKNPLPMEDRADVTAVAFSSDNRSLIVGDTNGRAWLWKLDTADNSWKEAAFLEGHGATITAAAFTASGDRVLTASGDKTVGQWDVATGKERRELALQHDDWVSSLAVSSDGVTALTACSDGTVQVWNINRPAVERRLQLGKTQTSDIDIAPNGKLAATFSAVDRTVRLWDLATGQEVFAPGKNNTPFLDSQRMGGLIWSGKFSPSSDYLVTIGGNDAQMWDVRTAKPNMSFSPHGAVASAAYSPDGKRVVTGSWDNSAKIWDIATGNSEVKLFGAHTGFVNSAVFSPDGAQVLTSSDDGSARLWDAKTGQVSDTSFTGHEGRVRSAVFSPNGQQVLTVSNDKTARIWDARTAREIQVLKGHEWAVRCGVFSHDGQHVLTGSEDSTARIWDAATGKTIFTLLGHSAPVTAVALSADGKRALTGSQDTTIKLWDAETGKEILTLTGHQQEVTSVNFSPVKEKHEVVSASRDGTAILWLAVNWQGDVQGVPVTTPTEPVDQEPAFVPPAQAKDPVKAAPPTLPKEFDPPALPKTKTSEAKQPAVELPTTPEKPAPPKEEAPSELPDLFPTKESSEEPKAKTPAEKPAEEPITKPTDDTTPAVEEPLPELPVDLFPPGKTDEKPAEKPTQQPEKQPIDLDPEKLPALPTESPVEAKPEMKEPPKAETPEEPLPELPLDLFPPEKTGDKPAEKPAEKTAPAKEPVEEKTTEEQPSEKPATEKPIEEPLPELPPDLFPSEGKKPAEKAPSEEPVEKAPAEKPAPEKEEPLPELPLDLLPPADTEKKPAEKKPAETSPDEKPSAEKPAADNPIEEPLPELPPDLFPTEEKKPAGQPPAEKPAEKTPAEKPAPDKEEPLPELGLDLFPPEGETKPAEKAPTTPEPTAKPEPAAKPGPEEMPEPLPTTEELPGLPDLFPEESKPEAKKPEAKPGTKSPSKPATKAKETPPPKLFND